MQDNEAGGYKPLGRVSAAADYTVSALWASMSWALATVLVRPFVTVEAFGAQAVATGLLVYFGSINGTVRSALDRDLPAIDPIADENRYRIVLSTAYRLLYAAIAVETVILIVPAIVSSDPYIRWAFGAAAAAGGLQAIASADLIVLKARERFRTLAKSLVLSATVQACMLVACAGLLGFRGMFLAWVAGNLCQAIWIRRSIPAVERPRIRGVPPNVPAREAVRRVLSVGVPVSIFSFIKGVQHTMDRYFVAVGVGISALGVYSLAISLTFALQLVPNSLAGSLLPVLVREVEGKVRPKDRKRVAHLAVCHASISVGVLALIGLHLGIPRFLPSYAGGLGAMTIAIMALGPRAAQAVPAQLRIARRRLTFLIVVAAIVSVTGAATLLVTADKGLEWIAWIAFGMSSVQAIVFSIDCDRTQRLLPPKEAAPSYLTTTLVTTSVSLAIVYSMLRLTSFAVVAAVSICWLGMNWLLGWSGFQARREGVRWVRSLAVRR